MDGPSCRRPRNLVWGFRSQVPISRHFHFSLSQFLCSISKPVSSPRPAVSQGWRAQGLSRTALFQRRRRLVLDRSEHDGTLDAVGMTIRGEPASGASDRAATLYSVGREDPNHDALMRIGSEAPRRRTHSAQRHDSHGLRGTPPPRTVIGNPSPRCGSSRNCQAIGKLEDRQLPSGGAHDDALRDHALSHQSPQRDQ